VADASFCSGASSSAPAYVIHLTRISPNREELRGGGREELVLTFPCLVGEATGEADGAGRLLLPRPAFPPPRPPPPPPPPPGFAAAAEPRRVSTMTGRRPRSPEFVTLSGKGNGRSFFFQFFRTRKMVELEREEGEVL